MADLDWSTLTWAEFGQAVQAYRDQFSRQTREDAAYLRCYDLLRADGSMRARAEHSLEIVAFLNAWACRLDSKKAPGIFRAWIEGHAAQLEALDGVVLTDPSVPGLAREVDALYDSLIALRPELHNMSDAAASKLLHQLVPRLFVMWDKAIKKAAGHESYAGFLTAMHDLSRRLLAEAGMGIDEAEAELQRRLGYAARKTFAKHVDEANWYWIVGRHSALHGAP